APLASDPDRLLHCLVRAREHYEKVLAEGMRSFGCAVEEFHMEVFVQPEFVRILEDERDRARFLRAKRSRYCVRPIVQLADRSLDSRAQAGPGHMPLGEIVRDCLRRDLGPRG